MRSSRPSCVCGVDADPPLDSVSQGKGKDEDVMNEDDLIATLEQYRQQWADEHKVTGESSGDGRRATQTGGTLVSCGPT